MVLVALNVGSFFAPNVLLIYILRLLEIIYYCLKCFIDLWI